MKMLIIGCGGVGSWLVDEIAKKIEQGQITLDFSPRTPCPISTIAIADGDIAELKQLKYQNFKGYEVGGNKAEVLAGRYKVFGVDVFEPIAERIVRESQLKGYDFFVLCVDNEATREMVIRYCHTHDKQFIDLRATGRRIFAMPKLRTLEENLRFIEGDDKREYSCQDKADLEKGWIQLGNKIIALIGTQMLMNFQRGISNRVITVVP